MPLRPALSLLPWLLGALLPAPAAALQIEQLSPQGEVQQPRQIRVRFDRPAMRFGDPLAPAPLLPHCEPARYGAGQGRWTQAQEWVYDFEQPLPSGVRCRLDPNPAFRAQDGQSLPSGAPYHFDTGGPRVQRLRPYEGSAIEENQHFVLKLDTPATVESLKAVLGCTLPGVGERVPVELLHGSARTEALRAAGLTPPRDETQRDETGGKHTGQTTEAAGKAEESQQWVALRCQRRLSPGAAMQLHIGPGLRSPNGLQTRETQRFGFSVREPLRAGMHCERENARSACLPIRPISVHFNAPVPRRLARLLRLQHGAETLEPRLEDERTAASAEDDRDGDGHDRLVQTLHFPPPFAEGGRYTLKMPAELRDASGRSLANAEQFPLEVGVADMPPLAKFAMAPFGIIERFAQGPEDSALLPVTLRRVEAGLAAQQLQIDRLDASRSDAEIIEWLHKVGGYQDWHVERSTAQEDVGTPLPPPLGPDEEMVESRSVSLLQGRPGLQTIALPGAREGDTRPFEVIGIPLQPGFHVLEIASQALGRALLDERYGPGRRFYTRTTALVTNLGVHFKQGRENALAWVTTLDQGQPVADARVRISDCEGDLVAEALTDAQGIARFEAVPREAPECKWPWGAEDTAGYFVSARARHRGIEDMAFTWSSWQRGIEAWRFNVPTGYDDSPELRAHTVMDRSLLRAGETLSMKHFLRAETRPQAGGFALPARNPDTLVITHVGSAQEYTQPLDWQDSASGGRSAVSEFKLPVGARLGEYRLALRTHSGQLLDSGSFRVEAFRLPVYEGRIRIGGQAPLVVGSAQRTAAVPVDVRLDYVSGGPASHQALQLSASVRERDLHFEDYADFSFEPPQSPLPDPAPAGDAGRSADTAGLGTDTAPGQLGATEGGGHEDTAEQETGNSAGSRRLILDKAPLRLDAQGAGRMQLDVPVAARVRELRVEASYADPNGEIQTLQGSRTLWPASVLAGIRAEHWVPADGVLHLDGLALDLEGKPRAGVPLTVRAIRRVTTSSRKRMVGGFYSYDNRTETRDLGQVCAGHSDAQGMLACRIESLEPGEIDLHISAEDEQGRRIQATRSVWVTGHGELWFGAENHDRMDLIPEKKEYAPGETARFQVRMPFREATALVTVEREGIAETQVVQLRGDDPSISLKVDERWSPNVYVSVLAVRGRLYDVPWYGFLQWGLKHVPQWWQAFSQDNSQYLPPTALIDLSKPAFRLGMAEIRVGNQAHRLKVQVETDRPRYQVREKASVQIRVSHADGSPARHAEVAVAAVDQALLELMPNRSWQLLEAMMARRAWSVSTATAQMEIVGRRHYGRKALPAGGDGGGGDAPTRELFDTLLFWQPRVQLDADGKARIEVPLNDTISSFQIVAVADSGPSRFGTGQTRIQVSQDLQIISGLPPLVRAGDRFRAMLTLRNDTARPMRVRVQPRATLLTLKEQVVTLPPNSAQPVHWEVTAPAQLAELRSGEMLWEIQANDIDSAASDRIKLSQRIQAAVPTQVQQASLLQLDGPLELELRPPAGALPGRGGLNLRLQPKLVDGLPAVQDWFRDYPHRCLEQLSSRMLVLGEAEPWQTLKAQMPAYLDEDGLAGYFPPRPGSPKQGSDVLSAWLLSATDEAAHLDPAWALSPEIRQRLLSGLERFVTGKLEPWHWAPRQDLSARKLAAIAALARFGAARPEMLASLDLQPGQMPTSALLDWIDILRRLKGIPNQKQRLEQATQQLRSRLSYQGSRIVFNTEANDYWWWLMVNGDVNAARLLLSALDDPAWRADLGRLATGLIARQQRGAWHSTTANLWGWLALQRFSRQQERTPVDGSTQAVLISGTVREEARAPWAEETAPPMLLPWPKKATDDMRLQVRHEGSGQPWLTLQSLAAVPRREPVSAGYRLRRRVQPVLQAQPDLPAGHYSRGDVLRVRLDIEASAPMTWVAITDPIPAGATILGSGLGRDSALLSEAGADSDADGSSPASLAFEERGFDSFRSYHRYLPSGTSTIEYTLRLNNPGIFHLPASRVEALYAPEMFGETPNSGITVHAE